MSLKMRWRGQTDYFYDSDEDRFSDEFLAWMHELNERLAEKAPPAMEKIIHYTADQLERREAIFQPKEQSNDL